MSFPTDWARPVKREMSFLTTKQSFQTGGKKNSNVLEIGNNKYKCTSEMCLTFFITGL